MLEVRTFLHKQRSNAFSKHTLRYKTIFRVFELCLLSDNSEYIHAIYEKWQLIKMVSTISERPKSVVLWLLGIRSFVSSVAEGVLRCTVSLKGTRSIYVIKGGSCQCDVLFCHWQVCFTDSGHAETKSRSLPSRVALGACPNSLVFIFFSLSRSETVSRYFVCSIVKNREPLLCDGISVRNKSLFRLYLGFFCAPFYFFKSWTGPV